MRRPPLIILEGCSQEVVARAHAEADAGGWRVVDGWDGAGYGVVCRGLVDSADTAAKAVLAAVAGAGLVVEATAEREVLDRLCDDLRHLGTLDHHVGECETTRLSAEQRALLELLLAGASLGEAARELHLSRRTADRRLATARRALGAPTTSEAVTLARRMGLRPRLR